MTWEKDCDRLVARAGNLFAPQRKIYISRAPGRLDLMGGNDDYTGGLVFEATIREATWCAAQARTDNLVVLYNPQVRKQRWQERVVHPLSALSGEDTTRDLARGEGVRWTAYVLGVLLYLKQRYPQKVKTGVSLYLESDVPLNKGVSSSAALEVAAMKAAAAAYEMDFEGVELAESCQWAENVIAESACGIMDQITSVSGDEQCILPLVCQPCLPERLIRLPDRLRCWAVDSGVSHQVSGVEYEAARAAAFMGYKLICEWEDVPVQLDKTGAVPRWVDPRWNGYLANVPPSLFRAKYESRLPETMTGAQFGAGGREHVDPFTVMRPEVTYKIRANTRYAVEENARVQMFAELARGSAGSTSSRPFRLMGDIMYQSHHAYTECGLGAEATDLLVDLAREEGSKSGIFGAKVTGGGAGGTVAILGLETAEESFRNIVRKFGQMRGSEPYVFEGSSIGADKFGIVVREI
ncbi:MAG: galactokinase [Candidatus Hydrogenedentes bacterium]|nr:galactokinase [Candidatus Hydrogenedentota bacterium]